MRNVADIKYKKADFVLRCFQLTLWDVVAQGLLKSATFLIHDFPR